MRKIRDLGSLPQDAFDKYQGLSHRQVSVLHRSYNGARPQSCSRAADEEIRRVQSRVEEVLPCQQEGTRSVRVLLGAKREALVEKRRD